MIHQTENLKLVFENENDNEDLDIIKATNLCTLAQYKIVYPRFKKEFMDEYEDYTELLFIEKEIKNALNYIEEYERVIRNYHFEMDNTPYDDENREIQGFYISCCEKWIASQLLIINFLNNKLKESSLVNLDENDIKIKKNHIQFSGKAKLIGMNELGFIDLIKSNCSPNTPITDIADAIAPLVGEKLSTMRSYFNQLLSESAQAEYNSPYHNPKTVQKVKDYLKSKNINLKKV